MMFKHIIPIGLGIMLLSGIHASVVGQQPNYLTRTSLTEGWQIHAARDLPVTDSLVSSAGFAASGWRPAIVPGSVLGSLVADSLYPHIFFGRNLEKIPDSLFSGPWWYRTHMAIHSLEPGTQVRLRFNGVNYRADVWLNGHKIASADTLRGGFCQFSLEATPWVKPGDNILAVKVFPPEAGDLTLGFVDWNPSPPDHNMGIWRNILLEITGPVSVDFPYVYTKVDTATLAQAEITVRARVTNHSGAPVKGTLSGTIGTNITFADALTLGPHETREVVFSPDRYAQLVVNHPRLWWTHTLGQPNLYGLHLQFTVAGRLSDSSSLRFGIRSVSDYLTADGHRGFKLNGKKILIRGGGWTDPMLLNATPEYEEAGIDYAVHMNLNALRMEGFWGKDSHLYDLCDEKGILLLAGLSCQWEWAHLIGLKKEDKYSAILTPEQNAVAARSWHDQICWLRNHPSIIVWLYGSDKWPRPSLEKKYLDILQRNDPSRPAIASAKEWTSEMTGPTAVKMRGPYDYVPPDYWYIDTSYGGAFGFNTETGPGPQIPVLESLRKMIPADSLWPPGNAWLYHAARGKFHNFTAFNQAMESRLGKPTGLSDYLRKAQYLGYEGMRAMYEAFEANRFRATGVIQWMFNSSWPKLWWQLYDYYLMPTGAFYGARKAGEPLHIAFNYGDRGIDISNNTGHQAGKLTADIQVLDSSMHRVFHHRVSREALDPRHTAEIYRLPASLPVSRTYFLDLRLYGDPSERPLSTNFYVLSIQRDSLDEKKSTWYITPEARYADLTGLERLPEVSLQVRSTHQEKKDTTFVSVTLKNPTDHLAFMVYLDLKKGTTTSSVTPVFWQENFFSLLPGEERTVSGYCHTRNLQGQPPHLTVGGWNIEASGRTLP